MNMVNRVIIGTMDKTGASHHKSQFDLTLHVIALNIRLQNHDHSTIGALCFIGIVMNNYQYVLPITYGSRG